MSIIFKKSVSTESHKNYVFNIEKFDSAFEIVRTCNDRPITDSNFHDMRTKCDYDMNFEGVKSYDEALQYLEYGYAPSVEKMKEAFKKTKGGDVSRYTFKTEVVGEVPIVPLALKGLPKDMISLKMRPIKDKVIDLYYDIGDNCIVDSEHIIAAGQKMLSAIISLEKQGYRFNIYVTDNYANSKDCDAIIVKVKSSTQPLNLRRISFPVTHSAFFRVIGFDWYSKFPKGKYRFGYGHVLRHEFDEDELDDMATQLFGENSIYISSSLIRQSEDPEKYIKEKLNGNSKT